MSKRLFNVLFFLLLLVAIFDFVSLWLVMPISLATFTQFSSLAAWQQHLFFSFWGWFFVRLIVYLITLFLLLKRRVLGLVFVCLLSCFGLYASAATVIDIPNNFLVPFFIPAQIYSILNVLIFLLGFYCFHRILTRSGKTRFVKQ